MLKPNQYFGLTLLLRKQINIILKAFDLSILLLLRVKTALLKTLGLKNLSFKLEKRYFFIVLKTLRSLIRLGRRKKVNVKGVKVNNFKKALFWLLELI